MDECMKGCLDTLIFSTSLQLFSVLSKALAHYTTAQHHTLCFLHSTNRLLILTLFPVRAHSFQSHRWECPKIELESLACWDGLSVFVSELLSSWLTERRECNCLCDCDQYIITFLSPQWRCEQSSPTDQPIKKKKSLACHLSDLEKQKGSQDVTPVNFF